MKSYKINHGDLELLALDMLSDEQQKVVLAALGSSEALRAEYELIQESLFLIATQNAIPVPISEKITLPDLNVKDAPVSVFTIFKSPIFRVAASILLIGSILGNLYLFQKSSRTDDHIVGLSTEMAREALDKKFIEELPFDEELFEGLFAHLHTELEAHPCGMDFKASKAFLSEHGLDTPENLAFLKEHGSHCDCEVLMNLTKRFPKSPYHHGDKPPVSHQSANIKLAAIEPSLSKYQLILV